MKKTLFLLSILLIAIACSKDNQFNPNAMISLRPAEQVISTSLSSHLTPLQIVQQAYVISWIDLQHGGPVSTNFEGRDLNLQNLRLLIHGAQVIDQFEGNSHTTFRERDFIAGRDIVLAKILDTNPSRVVVGPSYTIDTIAYIPNAVFQAAGAAIKAAYEDDNYAECYRLFDTAFTFIPITGAEWRELKAAGQN